MSNLVIVESPTKAKKLTEYLGKGYKVMASMGHIRDLPKSKMGVDLKTLEPDYIKVVGKGDLIKKLRAASSKAKIVYLAMDRDREGEAIAWHVQHLLIEGTKDTPDKFKRITFNQITKKAILEAINNPGDTDMKMVDAQQARRVLDRLVGYTLSPVLWKKVRRGLSAGRVQSVALRMLVEKEEEIGKFIPTVYFDVSVNLLKKPEGDLATSLISIDGEKAKKDEFLIVDKKRSEFVVSDLKTASYVVSEVKKRARKRQPYAPFTTSTLQQAAATNMGWSAKQTMSVAQKLYEEGKITYHRTDSINLAAPAIAASVKYVETTHGKEYLPDTPRVYKSKTKNAQEAHEAIRPTDPMTDQIEVSGKLTARHVKLYKLIWQRTVASQMAPAVYDATTVDIEALPKAQDKERKYGLRVSGSIQKFDGWRVLYKRNTEDMILPDVSEGDALTLKDVVSEQKETLPPPRFNDASLIKAMEEKGIGRPSTYAPTISTILFRGYVERKEKRFFATSIGITVIKFLRDNFKEIIDYDFTAEMEEDLDRISRGEKKWKPVAKEFYKPFASHVKHVEETAERVAIPVEKTGETCPECKKGEVVIRTGRFGKFYACDQFNNKEAQCKYTKNFVEKLEMKCPKCVEDGLEDDKAGDVVIKKTKKGRSFYGCSRYPDCDWASWKNPMKEDE